MIKPILKIALIAFILIGTPIATQASEAVEIIDNDFQEIGITVNGSTVRVVGANGMVLSIYNVAGVRIMTAKIDSSDKSFEVSLPKGCYIMKIGKTVRKISIP